MSLSQQGHLVYHTRRANILAFSSNKINSDMSDKADQKMPHPVRQRVGGSPPPARTHSPITDHSLSHGHIDLHRQFNHYCFSPIYKEKCFSFNGCADSNEMALDIFFACSEYFSTIQKTYMCTVNNAHLNLANYKIQNDNYLCEYILTYIHYSSLQRHTILHKSF